MVRPGSNPPSKTPRNLRFSPGTRPIVTLPLLPRLLRAELSRGRTGQSKEANRRFGPIACSETQLVRPAQTGCACAFLDGTFEKNRTSRLAAPAFSPRRWRTRSGAPESLVIPTHDLMSLPLRLARSWNSPRPELPRILAPILEAPDRVRQKAS